MTARREALALPLILLTVVLLGGIRMAAVVRLAPPTVMALVLAMLLLGAFVRAGVMAPDRLMNATRSPLENASGAMVLGTLFAASAQIFNLVTPDTGLLHALFNAFLVVQLLTLLAGIRGRRSLLRSLVVLLGSTFVLRFIVLEGLYAPQGGITKRVLTAVLEGISLGTIDYVPNAPATGYIGLFTIALYLIAVTLLPPARRPAARMRALRAASPADLVLLLIGLALAGPACRVSAIDRKASGSAHGGQVPAQGGPSDPARAAWLREEALRGARVWHTPAVPIPDADLSENPAGPRTLRSTDEVPCRFVLDHVGGTTPKFDCQLSSGETIRVKYGQRNPEPYAEVAATRLLTTLGFGTDRMYLTRRIRCAGCPRFPFLALRCAARTGLEWACFPGGIDAHRTIDFDWPIIERRREGRVIEATDDQGWNWYELDRIDPARGGSSLAEVDALRLLAVLLAHWDNKGKNQRLVCPPGADRPDGGCAAPEAIVQDLGATFGPLKLDLHNWRETPVWAEAAMCTVSMAHLPFHGATFPDRRISEAGRLKLLGLLDQLSDRQLRDLFSTSRVTAYDQILGESRDPSVWVAAFRDKTRQIREGGPCRD
jgi:hypothetical protein